MKRSKEIKGKPIDSETRCIHYNSLLDVIAIKFKCCVDYYPCYKCHEEMAGHASEVWEKEQLSVKAILCGVCNHEMAISEYLSSENTCPNCKAAFNPACSNDYHLYFEA